MFDALKFLQLFDSTYCKDQHFIVHPKWKPSNTLQFVEASSPDYFYVLIKNYTLGYERNKNEFFW